MAVPDNRMMELIRRDSGMASPTPTTGPTDMGISDSGTPPMASPMSTPEPKMGNREGAMINLSMAMDLIEQALPSLGSESEEGQKALAALRTLTGILGPKKGKTKELQSAEIMQMLQNLPMAGGATPEGKAMAAAPPVPGMAPPPSAPPTQAPPVGGAMPPSPM